MEESESNREESAPKRSRSSEEIKEVKDVSSSSDSGQQSPHDTQQQHNQNLSACNSNNNSGVSSNKQINCNSDSGLSFKMEDSSCGDADSMGNDLLKSSMDNESKKMRDDEIQETLICEKLPQEEESRVDLDKPTTSGTTPVINRHKRNRSRNYRMAGRSSSSSSNSSTANREETQKEEPQPERDGSQETANASEDPASPGNSTAAEMPLPPSPYMFLSNMHDSSSSSSSSDSLSDSNDDDTDFEPSLFGDRLSPIESGDSNRIKEKDEEVNKVLNKQKPAYKWCGGYELMRREHGLSGDPKSSLRNGFSYGFQNRFYASRHIVERMKISHILRKHTGCVNCVNFNKAGDLLVTGSDDARLIVWDWAGNKTKHVWKSGHSANIFQSKFIPSSSCIDIISAGRDGKVIRSVVPPSGGEVQVSNLYPHSGAVHKLVICPDNPSEIISVGEDGCICSKDLREDKPKVDMLKVFSYNKKPRKIRLFSISHHPFAPEICVSGSDQYVRVYDKRSMREPVHYMSPEYILETHSPNVTCCVYNNTGTEILATYSEDNIYLFDNKNYVAGEYLHSYKGHFNQKTIKGVNFFGPNSEYVISGSDCGNIFYWDKNTEAILNFMSGDAAGVVNCLEPHPNTPILATSGLDRNIKIWTPNAEKYPPDLTKLTQCVRHNIRRTAIYHNMDLDDGQMNFFIRQILCRRRAHRRHRREGNNDDESDIDNIISSDDSSLLGIRTEEGDSDEDSDLRNLSCGTQ